MLCPYCQHPESQVIDTRQSLYNQIPGVRRRRKCEQCSKRFSSFEMTIHDLEGVEPATLDGLLQQIIKLFKEAPATNYKAPSSLISDEKGKIASKMPTISPKTPYIENGISTKEAVTASEIKKALQRARQRYADELDASEFDDEDFD